MSAARTYVGPLRAGAGQDGDVSSLERDALGALEADLVRSYVGPLRASADHAAGAAGSPPTENGAPVAEERMLHAADTVRIGMGPLRGFAGSAPEADAPAAPEYNDVLDTAHAPTVKVMDHLRDARQRLQRAAQPELRLSPAIRALWRTEQRLGRPLRIAICGEINAGKSSLANLLAGIESLPTAVTINTLIPTLLYYAAQPEIWAVQRGGKRERLRGDRSQPGEVAPLRIEVGLPSPRLATMQILDLPGFTGSRWGTPVVELASHHVDATIWCTVSTQAWKESERSAWSMLSPRLSARSLLVATHTDLLHRPDDRQSLMTRLYQEVGTAFMGIVPLATLDAIAVMGESHRGGDAWDASGAKALEVALAALLLSVREQRAAAAQTVTGRIAQRALTRLEHQFGGGSA
jgi:hypothetical protein